MSNGEMLDQLPPQAITDLAYLLCDLVMYNRNTVADLPNSVMVSAFWLKVKVAAAQRSIPTFLPPTPEERRVSLSKSFGVFVPPLVHPSLLSLQVEVGSVLEPK